MASNENIDAEALKSRVDEQANLVRKLKSDSSSNKVGHKNIVFNNNSFNFLFYSRMKSQLLFKNY